MDPSKMGSGEALANLEIEMMTDLYNRYAVINFVLLYVLEIKSPINLL